jgi:hypothetical protein
MTAASGGSADADSDAGTGEVRQAVTRMLQGSGLQIRELEHELVIVNPRDPERGQVHVAYSDGYVAWERVTWDYWGRLEGFADDADTKATAAKIIDTLIAK